MVAYWIGGSKARPGFKQRRGETIFAPSVFLPVRGLPDTDLIAGVVLAAGRSSRMGSPKALLDLHGRSFVSVLVQAFSGGGCDPVIVVTGPEEDDDARAIAAAARGAGARVVVNPDRGSDQIDSLRIALRVLPPEVTGAIVSPVDSPGATGPLVESLIRAAATGAPIVVPTAEGRRGHPIYLGRDLFEELLADDLIDGARTVVRRHESRLLELPVADREVLLDVDTPDDYRRLKEGRS